MKRMEIQAHLVAALAGAAATCLATAGDLPASALFFASAFLIDADHVLDFFLIYRRLDFGRMIRGHFYKDRIWVLLHSAEIPIAALVLWPGIYSIAFAAGYFLHLALDAAEYSFRNPLLTYFFSYRLAMGFSKQKLCLKSDDLSA
jgi:hypothetical protein